MTEPTKDSGVLGLVQRELNGIREALQGPQPPKRHAELHAAQQALSWAIDPEHFASPLMVIMTTDTQDFTRLPPPSRSKPGSLRALVLSLLKAWLHGDGRG